MMLSFSDTSSRQAAQNNFPADTVIISLENSLALCPALTPFGSDEQAGRLCRTRLLGGSLALTLRLRIKSDGVGALNLLSSDGGPVDDAAGSQSSLDSLLLLSGDRERVEVALVAMMIRT